MTTLITQRCDACGGKIEDPENQDVCARCRVPRIRLSYGMLPEKSVYCDRFEAFCPDGGFSFGNDKRVGTCTLSCEELWREIVKAMSGLQDDDAWDWTSCVLDSLNIEWI